MKYKYFFFDMDGTVLNTLEDLRDSVNHCLREFGLPSITREQTRSCLGNGARYLIEHAVPEGTPPEITEEILKVYIPYYQAHSRVRTAPYEGIPEMMQRLKAAGGVLAVVSNKPDGAVQELAETFFPELLDVTIGETPQIRRKPAPDTVLAAMERMHAAEKNLCVYIGDTEVDIQTAENAGIDGIAVAWGFRSREALRSAGAETIADTVAELENMLIG